MSCRKHSVISNLLNGMIPSLCTRAKKTLPYVCIFTVEIDDILCVQIFIRNRSIYIYIFINIHCLDFTKCKSYDIWKQPENFGYTLELSFNSS